MEVNFLTNEQIVARAVRCTNEKLDYVSLHPMVTDDMQLLGSEFPGLAVPTVFVPQGPAKAVKKSK